MTNDKHQLAVADHYELSALHKAIHEAKFMDATENSVWRSPFVAAIANRLVDTMIAIDAGTPILGTAEEWEAWRLADQSRLEWPVCVRWAREIKKWPEWPTTKKRDIAALFFSPLHLTDEKMEQFLAECDVAPTPEE